MTVWPGLISMPPATGRIFMTPLSIFISWTSKLAGDRRRAADQAVGLGAGIGDGHIAAADAGAFRRGARPGRGDFEFAGRDVGGLHRQCQKAEHGGGHEKSAVHLELLIARLPRALVARRGGRGDNERWKGAKSGGRRRARKLRAAQPGPRDLREGGRRRQLGGAGQDKDDDRLRRFGQRLDAALHPAAGGAGAAGVVTGTRLRAGRGRGRRTEIEIGRAHRPPATAATAAPAARPHRPRPGR